MYDKVIGRRQNASAIAPENLRYVPNNETSIRENRNKHFEKLLSSLRRNKLNKIILAYLNSNNIFDRFY